MKYFYILVLIPVLTAGLYNTSGAQEPYFREEKFPSPIPELKNITGIASDKNHCIWFTTQAGIYRYDGSRFRHYSVQTTPVLKFERMTGVMEIGSLKGSRWAILDAKGNYYEVDEQSRLRNYSHDPGDSDWIRYHQYSTHLLNDFRSNKIYDSLWGHINEIYTLSDPRRTFLQLSNGDVYVLGDEKPINKISFSQIGVTTAGSNVQKAINTEKDFYLITPRGLQRWNERRKQMELLSVVGDISRGSQLDYSGLHFLRATLAEHPLLWYQGKIFETDISTVPGKMNTRLLIKSFPDEVPVVVYYSKPRQLFISYYPKNGIQFYEPAQFSLLAWDKPIHFRTRTLDYYYSLIPENNGFLTLNDAGITWLGVSRESRLLKETMAWEYFLFKDRQDNIWYQEKQDDQVCHLRAGDRQKMVSGFYLKKNVFIGAHQLSDNEFLFLSNRELYRVQMANGSVISSQIILRNPPNAEFHALYKKDNNIFWLGSDLGIIEYNISTGASKEIAALKNNYIRAMIRLNENNFLVGSYDRGIYLLQDDKWVHLTSTERKMPSSAHAFIIDTVGSAVWVSSNDGILRIPLEQLLKKDISSSRNITFRHFTDFGPDISPEFNGSSNVSGAKLSDSCFGFANAKGVVIFNPVKLVSYPLPETVLVEQAGGGDSLQIKLGKRQFAFDPIVPYYGNLQDLEIMYYLTNTDEQWHRFLPNSIISYNNIGPGSHELKFRIKYHHEPGGKEVLITAKKIDVPYRWYEKTWFLVAATLLGLGIIMLLHNLRLWYLLKRKRELESLVKAKTSELQETNDTLVDVIDELSLSESNLKQSNFLKDEYYAVLTHDLRSPLKFLSFNLGQLVDQTKTDGDDNLKKGLFAAYQCSTDVHKLIDEFVYWIRNNEQQLLVRPEPTKILNLLIDIKSIHSFALDGNHNKLVADIPETLVFNTDPKLLFIILRNAIDNANKYTLNGTITVSAKLESSNLEVTVADTGRGMRKELIEDLVALQDQTEHLNYKARKSLGFYIMAMMVKKLGGRYTLVSAKEKGTELSFIIPGQHIPE